jgi:hypothetical protein
MKIPFLKSASPPITGGEDSKKAHSCREDSYISFLFRQDILEKSNKQHLAAEAKKRQELKKQLKVIKYLTKIILNNEKRGKSRILKLARYWRLSFFILLIYFQ